MKIWDQKVSGEKQEKFQHNMTFHLNSNILKLTCSSFVLRKIMWIPHFGPFPSLPLWFTCNFRDVLVESFIRNRNNWNDFRFKLFCLLVPQIYFGDFKNPYLPSYSLLLWLLSCQCRCLNIFQYFLLCL